MYQTAPKVAQIVPKQEIQDANMAFKIDQEEKQKCYGKYLKIRNKKP